MLFAADPPALNDVDGIGRVAEMARDTAFPEVGRLVSTEYTANV